MSVSRKSVAWLVSGSIGAFAVFMLWSFLLLPSSVAEFKFRRALLAKADSRSTQVELGSLMPGEWELVCNSHGYAGDLHLSKYNRTYPPVAPPQDGVWGLVFIASDGTYTSAVGSCRRGGAQVRVEGCVPRAQATLHLSQSQGVCPVFVQ